MGIGLTSHTSDGVRLSAQLGSRVARCMLDTTMTYLDRSVVLLSEPSARTNRIKETESDRVKGF